MITNIIDLLQLDDYFGQSKRIDRAKGIYQYPKSLGNTKKHLIRVWKSKK
jgi:hypothetical protein